MALRQLEEAILREDASAEPTAPPQSSSNLPALLTRVIGRDEEPNKGPATLGKRSRLVTLVGPGGAGKTTLAIAAGGRIVERYRQWRMVRAARQCA